MTFHSQEEYETSRDMFLMRQEVLFAADSGRPREIQWLAPLCETTAEIADFLQLLGFEIADVENSPACSYALTTDGVLVYQNTPYNRGLVSKREGT